MATTCARHSPIALSKSFDLIGVYEQARAADEADLGHALSRIVAATGPPDITHQRAAR